MTAMMGIERRERTMLRRYKGEEDNTVPKFSQRGQSESKLF